jgi:hypothetical protein
VSGREVPGAAALALALALGAAGCGGWADDAIQNAQAREAGAAKNRRAVLEKRIDDHKAAIEKEPLDVDNNKYEVDKIAAEAQSAGLYDALKARLDKLKEDADAAFVAAAEKKCRDAADEARSLAKAGKMKDARRKIDLVPLRLRTTRYWQVCEDAVAYLDQVERTEAVWARDQKKADAFKNANEPEKARGVFESFLVLADAIPAFKESAHVQEAQKAVKDLGPEIEKAKAARAAEDAIKWLPAFSGRKNDLGQWDLSEYDTANVEGDVCVFKYGGGEAQTVSMMFGQEDWEDYVIEADVKIVNGPVYLNVHGLLEGPEGERTRMWKDIVELKSYEIAFGKWVHIRLEARNGSITLVADGKTTTTDGKPAKAPKGPFEFRIGKGAEIQLKKVFVKVYKPAKS